MLSSSLENTACLIAENVVSAFERDDGAAAFLAGSRGMAVAGLMRDLRCLLNAATL